MGGTTRGWSSRRIDSLTATRPSLSAAAAVASSSSKTYPPSSPSSPSSARADFLELKVKMLFVLLGILAAAVAAALTAAGEFCGSFLLSLLPNPKVCQLCRVGAGWLTLAKKTVLWRIFQCIPFQTGTDFLKKKPKLGNKFGPHFLNFCETWSPYETGTTEEFATAESIRSRFTKIIEGFRCALFTIYLGPFIRIQK